MGRDEPLVLKVLGNLRHRLLDGVLVAFDVDLSGLGLFVRGADTGKLLNLTGASLLVQALWVSLLGLLYRNVDPDLNEGQGRVRSSGLSVHCARRITVRPVGADEAGESDRAAVCKQLCNLAYTSNVFIAVLLAEAQVLVQPKTNVVAVETVRSQPQVEEMLLQSDGNGGLAGGGQPSEPDGETLLAAILGALSTS